VNTVSDKVVRHSLTYLSLQKWFAGDVSFYVNMWPKLTQPFENEDFQSIFARSVSADEHRTLSLSPPKGAQKRKVSKI